jgi:hypothetical protein
VKNIKNRFCGRTDFEESDYLWRMGG